VATVVLRGDPQMLDEPPALFRAANGQAVAAQPLNRVSFGRWGQEVPEDVVLCRTSECDVEIHCHGGAAAVRRVLNDLAQRGCRIVDWGEFIGERLNLVDAECTMALTHATTLRTARILLEQQSGVLRSAFEVLRDLPPDEVVRRTTEMLSWSEFGRHLTEPWQVVLCGLPNVGKSSLINALLGYARSIVFDQPGTTRDVVTGQTALDGWPVELSDTAGLRQGDDVLESAGIERAHRRAAAADLIVLVFDRSRPVRPEELELLRRWPNALRVTNKCDLPDAWRDADVDGALPVSSVTQAGMDELAKAIVGRLIPRVPAPGAPIPIMSRQVQVLAGIRDAAARGELGRLRSELGMLWEV
jgi:tRNA modification GTPase